MLGINAGKGLGDGSVIGDIERERFGLAAISPNGRDNRGETIGISPVDQHHSAGLRQGAGHDRTKTTPGASNQRHAPVQGETRQSHAVTVPRKLPAAEVPRLHQPGKRSWTPTTETTTTNFLIDIMCIIKWT